MDAQEIIKAFNKAYREALAIEIQLHKIKLRENNFNYRRRR